MAGIILPDKASDVIKVNGVCYEFAGFVDNPADTESSSIEGEFSACAECSAEFLNEFSFLLDGTDEYINYGDVLDATADFSVFIWVKRTTDGVILSKYRTSGSERSYYIASESSGAIRVIITSNGQYTNFAKDYVTTTTPLSDGLWHLVGFVFSDDDLDISIDGIELSSYTVNRNDTVNSIHSGIASLQIGANDGGSNYFGGNVEEPVIFNKRLSGAEQTELYNGGTAVDIEAFSAYANALGWWRMGDDPLDDPGGTGNVQDQIGTNHGTANNMEVGDVVADVP